jgi:GDPmannose 4,6-dehydratase
LSGFEHKIRFYQASTSEMFGEVLEIPQSEKTPFNPRSPYGCAKMYGHWITKNYRESYNMFACSGILFNHESERRGPTFVTQKVCNSVKQIADGTLDVMKIGNLDALRDWGYAKDYIKAMWLMLQSDTPDDYVVATGVMHSVREFIELAFLEKNLQIQWIKKDSQYEIGIDQHGVKRVMVDPELFRPSEVEQLCGNYQKIKQRLGWTPAIYFKELVHLMMI